jgi:hypothetical protein
MQRMDMKADKRRIVLRVNTWSTTSAIPPTLLRRPRRHNFSNSNLPPRHRAHSFVHPIRLVRKTRRQKRIGKVAGDVEDHEDHVQN